MEHITYSQMRILETAQSCRQLNNIYGEAGNADDVVGTQLAETARLLEEAAGVGMRAYTADSRTDRIIRKSLAEIGVRIESVMLYEMEDGKEVLSVMARSRHNRSIHAGEITACMSRALGRSLVLSRGSHRVITGQTGEFVFEEAPHYHTLFGAASHSKNAGVVSGDSYTYMSDLSGNTYMALADGMGTGTLANAASSSVMELFEQFAQTGFGDVNAVRLINLAFASHGDDTPVTIDCVRANLVSGVCRLVKMGAASTFIKNTDGVRIIKPSSLPAGVLEDARPDVSEFDLGEWQYIYMFSDGVADALPFYDKEGRLAGMIDAIPCGNPQIMADSLMEDVMFYLDGNCKDDMTILVMGVWKSKA